MKNKISFIFIIVILLSSCSRLPKKIVPQAKINADQTLLLAQKSEHQFENAGLLYQNAWKQYRMMADTEGQLLAISGLGRIALQQQDTLSYQHFKAEMQNIISEISPSKSYHLKLLELNRLHREKKWSEISEIAILDKKAPEFAKMQILAYKIQADTNLKQADEQNLKKLITWQKKFAKKLKKNEYTHPQVVANASYTIAYYYFLQKNFKQAEHFIKEAKKVDYQYGFFYNYAYDLWLEATIAKHRGEAFKAMSLWKQALLIFQEFDDFAMQQKITRDLESLKD
jgi:tetratricopeptide (TPR) repeat protein